MNNLQKSNSTHWKELLAALGVVLSLIFVGYEIRQNTAVARGQARQELAALNQDFFYEFVESKGYCQNLVSRMGAG